MCTTQTGKTFDSYETVVTFENHSVFYVAKFFVVSLKVLQNFDEVLPFQLLKSSKLDASGTKRSRLPRKKSQLSKTVPFGKYLDPLVVNLAIYLPFEVKFYLSGLYKVNRVVVVVFLGKNYLLWSNDAFFKFLYRPKHHFFWKGPGQNLRVLKDNGVGFDDQTLMQSLRKLLQYLYLVVK